MSPSTEITIASELGTAPEIDAAVDAIRGWGERCAWTGWDPYDALNSPFAPALSLGRPLGRRLLIQAVKTSPLNLRPLLRIPRERDAKGIALAVTGYARLARARDDAAAASAAHELADWLLAAATPSDGGIGWGYHFPVETRFFRYERGQPNAIATTFVLHALLDARELAERPDIDDAAARTAAYLLERLLVRRPRAYFRYVEGERDLIHNANLLVCAALLRTARALGDDALAGEIAAPLRTSLAAQEADGSWAYSERPDGAWVDNFHTGYVLESLATCVEVEPEVGPRLEAGAAFWERALFLPDGSPRGTAMRTLPVDAHTYAQAVETWLALAPWRPEAPARAERIAGLLVRDLLAADGHVEFERRRLWTSRIPFVRWTTGAAFRALARLLLARESPAEPKEPVHAHLG